jgi:hypothetical protein
MKQEKISDALNFIDDDLIERAEAARSRKKAQKPSVWVKWGTVAACACLVALGIYWKSSTSPETPNSDILQSVSTPTAPEQTVAIELEPTVTEPEPTAERANDAAGSAFDGFDREGYIFYYTYIDGTIIDYIGQDEFEAWKDTLSERVTIYNVVQHFNVPKELLLEESEVGMRLSGDTPNAYKGYITPEQVEILCSGDEAAVNEAFMDPDIALLADGKVYSVFWLATHTAEEYEAAGITPEAVETLVARAEAYGGTRLASVCDFAAINNTLAAYKELVAE